MRRIKKPHVDQTPSRADDVGQLSPREQAIAAQATKAIRTVHSKEDTRKQMALVLDGWVTGLSERATQAAIEKQHGIRLSIGRIRTLRARIQDDAKAEFERERDTLKLQQLARITRYRRQAEQKTELRKGEIVVTKEADHTALVKWEQLYADIAGTKEPIKIDVDIVHREALTEVVGSMTADMAERFVEAYDHMMQLAEAGARHTGAEIPQVLPRALPEHTNGITKKAS